MLGNGADNYDRNTHHSKARQLFNSLSSSHSYIRMDEFRGPAPRRQTGTPLLLLSSYVFDWVVLLVVGGVGYWLGKMKPNMRPFQLESPHISFPFTEKETVPMVRAGIANTVVPMILIVIISLVMVPGSTVPPGTPKGLIWRRKLWELHQGLLGLALSCCGAWFVTNGMKNMFGKPRPDMLSRCMPDLANVGLYVVGGIANTTSNGQLVSADICTQPDRYKLEDGFRSFPSGHSSSSSAGLLYLSLFIASKFAITIPFLTPANYSNAAGFSAFPSRLRRSGSPSDEMYELVDRRQQSDGTGAGWAWGPRSNDKAYWAGIGSYSYATNKNDWSRAGDEEEAVNSSQQQNLATLNTDYDSVRRAHIGTASTTGPMKRAENSSMTSRASPPPGHHMDADNRV
ncbi:PAP2 domain-containing protein [Magnaporthiopsis poae ATCC 64411]|uniref:PAP2 domain-containing protein n=1 Tax=Magnaporthiopsis poae (strain ATCC 64411 / 73-15) TaxID=644358 RepID=A0A0C4E2B7_MAGP6|nr:PAP2 domain-containing protein [Magnaporthiopsis poae ATCC 64411]